VVAKAVAEMKSGAAVVSLHLRLFPTDKYFSCCTVRTHRFYLPCLSFCNLIGSLSWSFLWIR
jgi:hypothetical protein